MSWTTDLVENLRYWINDLDSTNYTWTDEQLEKFLAVAAINVSQIDLKGYNSITGGPYTIDLSVPSISPDPTTNGSEGFSNLIVMKAACIIAGGELKKLGSTAGYKITDDRSTFDGTKAIDVATSVADNYCGSYNETLAAYKMGSVNIGQAILSPYMSANFSRGMWFNFYGPPPRPGGC